MLARQEGLTKTYNRFHDPKERSEDIAELRRLHVEMDSAVAAAYGWGDLELGHGFHETKQGLRYTISEAARREVLDRLLRLNHERYAEEVAAGLHEKKKGIGDRVSGIGSGKGGRRKASNTEKPHLETSGSPVTVDSVAAEQLDLFSSQAQVATTPDARHPMPDARHPMPDARHPMPDARHPMPDARHPMPDARHPMPDPYARLIALLDQRGSLTNGDIQVALGIDAEAARALLRRLVEEGRAAVEGQKRGTRYVRRDSR